MLREVTICWSCVDGDSVESFLVDGEEGTWNSGAIRAAVWRALTELQETRQDAVVTSISVRPCPTKVLR